MNIAISPFQPADQDAVRKLILDGLAGHFGVLDPDLNPDLDNIARHYADGVFLVARRATDTLEAAENRAAPAADRDIPTKPGKGAAEYGEIAGCGALVPLDAKTGEIVRMSVAADFRRQGIGRQILDGLCAAAKARGIIRVVLETTSSWAGVRRFYEDYGFRLTGYEQHAHEHQAHYALDI